ncbi:TrfB-related DNA-binding protein [Chromobacterium amazonense]|uniref:TrfB-related DNA-binding protein n=1 Tax=Chromobacterium amazonense TaxID=1382803 RepID=UPI00237D9024|nr:TrfB-related DNA-binding protein [Chromobacterium amazonense]MDE1715766.1 TrfB-related DNA-binding protein [Chromobacterium amazonense]
MTPEQFDILVSPAVLDLSGKNAEAARLVILDGKNMRDAAAAVGLKTAGTVSRAVTRIRVAHEALAPILRTD